MAKATVTQARLKELFHYQNGCLFWRINKGNVKSGTQVAKGHSNRGYKMTRIDGQYYTVHRIIFLWHHGYLPKEIDHINRIKDDNRIENLRAVTRAQNVWNSDMNDRARGVSRHTISRRWRATIFVENKQKHLGYFDSESEARQAYLNARKFNRGESP